MPSLKALPALAFVKIVEKLGFHRTRIRGSHHQFAHPDGRITTIPVHGNEPIGRGLLLKIIKKDLQMTRQEFEQLL